MFVVVMLLFRSAIADWNQVPSGSMYPSIYIGDRIVVDKLAYDLRVPFTLQRIARWEQPQRGDVVTFQSPVDGRLLVKRVVGVPGDTVELNNNQLAINGVPASYEPLSQSEVRELPAVQSARYEFFTESLLGSERRVMLSRSPLSRGAPIIKVKVPPDQFLMLGDNRDNSQDFRAIGFVDRDLILGRAESVAFSLDYDHYYQPRLNRFLTPLI